MGTSETPEEHLATYPELDSFINHSCDEVWDNGLFSLYERRPEPTRGSGLSNSRAIGC